MVARAALIGHGINREERQIAVNPIAQEIRFVTKVTVVNHRKVRAIVADVANFHSQFISELLLDGGANLPGIRRIRMVGVATIDCKRLRHGTVIGSGKAREVIDRGLCCGLNNRSSKAARSEIEYRAVGCVNESAIQAIGTRKTDGPIEHQLGNIGRRQLIEEPTDAGAHYSAATTPHVPGEAKARSKV